MNINFILPPITTKAAGGYKVVYQYANYLSNKGNTVKIFFWDKGGENSKNIPRKLTQLYRKLLTKFEPHWIVLDDRIKKYSIPNIDDSNIKEGDIVICTSIDTVKPTMELCKNKGIKFHLIQDHENWFLDEEEVQKIYELPIKKIAVSKYLANKIKDITGESIYCVSNGIDLNKFYPVSRESIDQYSIAMMYKENSRKNSEMGLRVFYELKKVYPKLKINLFGTDKPTVEFPEWIKFCYKASEEDLFNIYNESAIYCCTSIEEGFGLPSLEAMSCGCVLVTSDTMGSREYAINGENCLIYDVNSEKDLYDTLKNLLDNNVLYDKLQINGLNLVRKNYSLTKSCEKFESILLNKFIN